MRNGNDLMPNCGSLILMVRTFLLVVPLENGEDNYNI